MSKYKSIHGIGLMLSLALLLVPVAASGLGSRGKTLDRTADPIIIEGEHFPDLLSTEISHLRLFSFLHGRLAPIPFQVDQRDSNGNWVWDVIYTHDPSPTDHAPDESRPSAWHQSARERRTRHDEDPMGKRMLAKNDVLVFMAQDLGDRDLKAEKAIKATRGYEIEITDPVNGAKGWAYLTYYESEPPPPSTTRYMDYLPDERRVVSPVYAFNFSNDIAVIRNLAIDGTRVLDRTHIHGEAPIKIGPIQTKIRFTDSDVRGHVEGYLAGSVRILIRSVAFLDFGLGIYSPEVRCDHIYYRAYARVPACLSLRFPVSETSLLLTVDYGSSRFQRLLIGADKDVIVLNKGKSASLPGQDWQAGKWIALDSENGSVVSYVTLPQTLAGHAEARPYLAVGPGGKDQLGRNVTDIGEVGFRIHALPGAPKGQCTVYGIYVISPQPYRPGDGARALDLQANSLNFRVSRLPQAESRDIGQAHERRPAPQHGP